MNWTLRSSWTFDEDGSLNLAIALAKNETKFGRIKGIRIEEPGLLRRLQGDKTKWLKIEMTGTEEQKEMCDEFLMELMNGYND